MKDKYITANEKIRLQKLILKIARKVCGENFSTGGCTPFYSVRDWKDRGEEYGLKSELIVVHDGGDLSYFFNMDKAYPDYTWYELMRKELEKAGYYFESCTSWYTAIYKL